MGSSLRLMAGLARRCRPGRRRGCKESGSQAAKKSGSDGQIAFLVPWEAIDAPAMLRQRTLPCDLGLPPDRTRTFKGPSKAKCNCSLARVIWKHTLRQVPIPWHLDLPCNWDSKCEYIFAPRSTHGVMGPPLADVLSQAGRYSHWRRRSQGLTSIGVLGGILWFLKPSFEREAAWTLSQPVLAGPLCDQTCNVFPAVTRIHAHTRAHTHTHTHTHAQAPALRTRTPHTHTTHTTNATQRNTTHHSTAQHNTSQHTTAQHNKTQQSTRKHNTTQTKTHHITYNTTHNSCSTFAQHTYTTLQHTHTQSTTTHAQHTAQNAQHATQHTTHNTQTHVQRTQTLSADTHTHTHTQTQYINDTVRPELPRPGRWAPNSGICQGPAGLDSNMMSEVKKLRRAIFRTLACQGVICRGTH